ncbi:polysaccharide export outer membrane protein [Dysgonomonas hofstadii]|uniref:Polysaccharide export outer membrane protein n=1 Tax=Dysgonomonas hofstadii TaxID=637886 RepID=A0A840CUK2_9BACT|nr:polysaccharide biosynthesis/export family protein [Dysgonomonas hofstadii]MBB4037364.1 polysaccharide export outer membrane protein [Dysgonomonas hofstadii]
MKLLLRRICLVLLIPVLLGSCTAYKKIPYLTDAELISTEEFAKSAENYEAKIMPKDVLSITVNTPTREAASDFNLPILPSGSNNVLQTQITNISTGGVSGSLQNYIVDNSGFINFPVIGKIEIGGLTKKEAEKKIYSLVYPKYLKEEPIVNIRFLNYKVAVLGEVARPGLYTSENEQMTLFDALASAGDLTIYGNRKNVLLVRENADGERSVRRIDLQDKDVLLNNDIYYLQQNDKIIVSPNKAKGNNSSFGTFESLALSGLSILISVIAIITR